MDLGVLGETGLWQRGPSPNLGETRAESVLEGGFDIFNGGNGDLGDLSPGFGLLSGLRAGLLAGVVLPAMVPQNQLHH